MKRYYVNLKPYFDSPHIFPASAGYDLKQHYVEEDFRFGVVGHDGVYAYIDRNEEHMDSADCAGQIVEIEDTPCDSVAIVGACSFGMYSERFGLKFSDGSMDFALAKFGDWYWPMETAMKTVFEYDIKEYADYNHILAKKTISGEDHCFFYYYKTDLNIKGRKLRQIVFPDNMFMTVFAITVSAEA